MHHFYGRQKVAVGGYDYGAIKDILDGITQYMKGDINIGTIFFGTPEKSMAERAINLVSHEATTHGFDPR